MKRWLERFLRGVGVIFLAVGPVIFFLKWWPNSAALAVAFWLIYLRTLVDITCRKLLASQPKGRRNFDGPVDGVDLRRLQELCQRRTGGPTAGQVNYFALSILSPRVIRRRVIDQFIPSRRTLEKSVSVEVDLNPLGPLSSEDDIYVVLTTPRKGVLYDNLLVLDGNGNPLPRLSYRECRVLAALTLRSLLQSAFGQGGLLSDDALAAERPGLEEIIRFAWDEQRTDETAEQYATRVRRRVEDVKAVVRDIANLEIDGGNREFLRLAAELVWQLSQSYPIVAVIPRAQANSGRFMVRYVRTLIPHLRVGRLLSYEGVKDRLRMFLGSRPVFLTVNARNAGTCQSYHLQIEAPQELYVGDFDIKSVVEAAAPSEAPNAGRQVRPYWRLRGRRGQHYFHLYTRSLQFHKPNALTVSVRFFEVPPGSIARAGVAAIATFIATVAVAFAVSRTTGWDGIDGQVAVFLLAAPGIAAAWLGLEPRPGLLLDGTLAARLSTVATFFLSMIGNIVLLLNRADVYPIRQVQLLTFFTWDLTWTLIVLCAFTNMLVTMYTWWQRGRHYELVAIRSTDDSSGMPK